MKTSKVNLTRREFSRLSLLGAGVAALPNIIPARLLGASAPSNRVRVGQIACGRIARDHDMPAIFHSGLADIIAVCDLDSKRAAEGKKRVEDLHAEKGSTPAPITVYRDYAELLARSDIDAVAISTPDHWHAELALAAVHAGKDVYLQKPMTMTHAEGILLRAAVAKTGRIFQLGSQQRCNDPQFRKACEFVRSGRVGRLKSVEIGLPIDPTAPDNPPQPVPANLDYNRWLGPTPDQPYTEQRVHPQKGYGRPGWLRNDAYCLGMITGWGAHHYDILHWALDCELGGPSRVEGRGEFPTNKIWNVHGAYDIQLTYPGGVIVHVSNRFPNGLKFIGDEGWIFTSRNAVATKDPSIPRGRLQPLHPSDPKLIDPKGLKVELPRAAEHHLNWLECVRSRKSPMVPAPVAHRGNAACIVSWIAMKLGRPLTWDPKAEKFVGDAEANAMLTRPERAPYGALRLAKKLGYA